MWTAIVGTLVGKVAPQVAEYYMEKKRLEAEAEMERLKGKIAWEQGLTKRAMESEGRDHEWEMAMIAQSGYKDEWVLFLVSIPLVLSFVPGTVAYVQMGFAALEMTPDWYKLLVLTILFAVYGVRYWRRKITLPGQPE